MAPTPSSTVTSVVQTGATQSSAQTAAVSDKEYWFYSSTNNINVNHSFTVCCESLLEFLL